MMSLSILPLRPDEALRLRDIRLRALEDAPDAFGVTLAEAVALPPDDWERQLQVLPTFVAADACGDVGMARLAHDRQRAEAAWLISVWVAPTARGCGVGAALVAEVVALARLLGKAELLLDVADLNAAAIRLYERLGFQRTGETSTLPPPRTHITEHRRLLRLPSGDLM